MIGFLIIICRTNLNVPREFLQICEYTINIFIKLSQIFHHDRSSILRLTCTSRRTIPMPSSI